MGQGRYGMFLILPTLKMHTFYREIPNISIPPENEHDNAKSTMNEDVYFLLNIGNFHHVMLVFRCFS